MNAVLNTEDKSNEKGRRNGKRWVNWAKYAGTTCQGNVKEGSSGGTESASDETGGGDEADSDGSGQD